MLAALQFPNQITFNPDFTEMTTGKDSQPQEGVEVKKKIKKPKKVKNQDGNSTENVKPISNRVSRRQIRNAKRIEEWKNKVKKETSLKTEAKSDVFSYDEIASNEEASSLINDLVKCYTCNSTLPQSQLDVLNRALYEKTVTVFLHILNKCIEKIFNKFLSTDFFKGLASKKVMKKDAVCQTDVSHGGL